MGSSSFKWFAVGAATCAMCFVLGGQSAPTTGEPKRLVVDELVVRKSLTVGPGSPAGAMWYMEAGTSSANLSARSVGARSSFEVNVLPVGAAIAIETQGLAKDLTKRNKQVRLSVADFQVTEPAADALVNVGMIMQFDDSILDLRHEGGKEAVWKHRSRKP